MRTGPGVDPYSRETRACFFDTRHAGAVDGESAVVGSFEDRGLHLRLSAQIRDNRLQKLRFLCWGCPHSIAAAEAFCRQFEGKNVAELEAFDTAQIMLDLGVPVEKTGRILALEDTVRSLVSAIRHRPL